MIQLYLGPVPCHLSAENTGQVFCCHHPYMHLVAYTAGTHHHHLQRSLPSDWCSWFLSYYLVISETELVHLLVVLKALWQDPHFPYRMEKGPAAEPDQNRDNLQKKIETVQERLTTVS